MSYATRQTKLGLAFVVLTAAAIVIFGKKRPEPPRAEELFPTATNFGQVGHEFDRPVVTEAKVVRCAVRSAEAPTNIVVSAGSESGVHEGMELTVTRDGAVVATLVVSKVLADQAFAGVKSDTPTPDVRPGDECEGRVSEALPR